MMHRVMLVMLKVSWQLFVFQFKNLSASELDVSSTRIMCENKYMISRTL